MFAEPITVQRSPLLDTHEAAAYLGVPRQTLAVWRTRHHKTGPAYVRIGRYIKYRQEDLDAYITAQRVNPKRADDLRRHLLGLQSDWIPLG